MTPAQALGQTLRALREARHLSQEDLALDSGYSRYYVSLIEQGRRNATVLALFHLARVLQTTPSAILRETEARVTLFPPRQHDGDDDAA